MVMVTLIISTDNLEQDLTNSTTQACGAEEEFDLSAVNEELDNP